MLPKSVPDCQCKNSAIQAGTVATEAEAAKF